MRVKKGRGCVTFGALSVVAACLVFTGLAISLVATGEIPQGAPRLIDLAPQASDILHPLMLVSLTFDQPMDRASVEEGLSIEPPISGTFRWSQDGVQLDFEPDAPGYTPGATYTLTLAPGVRAGTLPRSTRDGALRHFSLPQLLASSDPQAGAQDLGPWTQLSASFHYTLSCPSTLKTFSIAPHTDGLLECRGGAFGFSPRQPLLPNTTYVASLGHLFLSGEALPRSGVSWAFRTADPLSVVEVSPGKPGFLIDLWTPVEITFNRRIVSDSVPARFSLFGAGGVAVSGQPQWSEDGSTFSFQPDRPLVPGREYRYLLREGVVDHLGFALESAVGGEFVTLHLLGMPLPVPGARAVPLTSTIRLPFTRPMDTASVETGLSFDPAIEGDVAWIEDTLVFTPVQGLAPQAIYDVKVSAEVRDASGAPLAEPRRWAFETGPLLLVAAVPSRMLRDLQMPMKLRFGLPMDRASVKDSLSITPTTEGLLTWTGESTVVFRPEPGWLPASKYEVVLRGGAKAATGRHTVGQDYTWTFTTRGPDGESGD
ncbi:Ig-like domain-containing protein [Chloroflexota bacterium]